eukprot:CCRYP_018994-RA/>CCRYP_018994-RA protein AED:0.45 eAED:1.00 QI:0/-1/0/1/-1/0/1/0/168
MPIHPRPMAPCLATHHFQSSRRRLSASRPWVSHTQNTSNRRWKNTTRSTWTGKDNSTVAFTLIGTTNTEQSTYPCQITSQKPSLVLSILLLSNHSTHRIMHLQSNMVTECNSHRTQILLPNFRLRKSSISNKSSEHSCTTPAPTHTRGSSQHHCVTTSQWHASSPRCL